MKKNALMLLAALTICLMLSGCVLTDKLTSLKEGFNKETEWQPQTTPTVVIDTQDIPQLSSETKTVILYFTDASGEILIPEERAVPKAIGIARVCLEELIKGPVRSGLVGTLPASTQLLDINIRPDGLCIADFSGDLVEGLPVSAKSEKLAVYAIVNTLTQFPTVERVEMRVEGKTVDTLLGYVKLNQNLVRNASLIQ